jgi:DNA adenine methylase
MDVNGNKVKPFLRWAGGKRWLLPLIENLLINHPIDKYYEPFLGGGSVFFHIDFQKAFISDINPDLINTYKEIRDNLSLIIKILGTFENTEENYYQVRDNHNSEDKTYNAARFIFLNHTSYNGLYRVNKQGYYNVPYGYKRTFNIDFENLKLVQSKLKQSVIYHRSFETIEEFINPGDTIFLDPPYTVSHNKNGFIKYNQKLFTLDDQVKLSKLVDKIIEKNAYYILTNGAHEAIKKIFLKNNSNMIVLERQSLLGGKNAKRAKIEEYLFTNLPRS